MLVLLAIGFAAGVITAVSPCVLPVLPILLAGGASGDGRRPYAIIAGLVASFTIFTLTRRRRLLSALAGCRTICLRNVAIGLLFVLAATLVWPRLGQLIERPFGFLDTPRSGGSLGGGFVLGASLGLVFVPCAGPVLAAITVLTAEHRFSIDSVLLTLSYALGAGGPMLLLIALGGQRVARKLRAGGDNLRRAMGVVVALTAVAIIFNTAQSLQTALGSYSTTLQRHIEDTSVATKHLDALRGGGSAFAAAPAPKGSKLPILGRAPEFTGNSAWLNTPGDKPLTLASLRGKVVLVDFWTYSCINCIRTLPHLRAWYDAYHKDGFEIVGVHTPEFAFEHVLSNVRGATQRLGVTWPVALDNDYKTWTAYSNQYWPAEYLIDKQGRVREAHFGEGEYGATEASIRSLLAEAGDTVPRQTASVKDVTPTEVTTPESYLGYLRLERYAGNPIRDNKVAHYSFPATLPQNDLSYSGRWQIGGQRALAVKDARLRLHFVARYAYIVLGGKGRVETYLGGRKTGSIDVNADRLYTVVSGASARDALLELRFSPGVNAYAFTFG